MIDLAVTNVANQLNQYLKRRFSINEDVVIASNILEQDGTISPNINNKVVIFLVNIEKENFYKTGHSVITSYSIHYTKLYERIRNRCR